MLKYYYKLRFYNTPDDRGGAQGNASGQQDGNQQLAQSPQIDWDKIDLDSLDDDTRAQVEAAKSQIATLQKRAEDNERLARQHQSRYDSAQAELNRVKQAVQPSGQQQQQPQTAADRAYAQLVASGMPEDAAKAQAKILGGILEQERAHLKTELQRDFAPVAGIALSQQAEGAFNVAVSSDRVGALQVPEVKQLVWNACVELAQSGQPVTPEVVKNLAAMHYYNHIERVGGNFASLQTGPSQPNNGMTPNNQPPAVPFNTGGGFNYPGSTFNATTPQVHNPNAARTVLDPTTQAALKHVTDHWNRDLPANKQIK